jgi:hypothetical protein
MGIRVHDPMDRLATSDGVLQKDLIADDGTHGNVDYGTRAVQGYLEIETAQVM